MTELNPKTRRAIVAAAAAVLSLAAFSPSMEGGFHFDDGHSIEDNVSLRSFSQLPRWFTDITAFSPLASNRSYRPVLLVTLGASHALGGGQPWAYHLLSMLLHALGAFCVALLLGRVMAAHRGPSRFAVGSHWWPIMGACIFAVHPLLSEAVAYISARSTTQAAVFMFASVLSYIIGREEQRRRWIAASFVFLVLALATKLIAVTTVVLIIAWELLLSPRPRQLGFRQHAARLWPFLVFTVGFTWLHESLAKEATQRGSVGPFSFFLTESQVWIRFIRQFFWPHDLCADLTMPWAQSALEWPVARSLAIAVLLGVAAFWFRRRLPALSFGLIWYFVALGPTHTIVPLAEPASEHRVYVAIPGLLIAAAAIVRWALEHRPRLRPAATVLLVVAVAASIWASRERSKVWKTERSLWASVIECAPDNGRAHLNYGRGLWQEGDTKGARQSFERCAELWPQYAYCYFNLSALDLLEEKVVQAELHAQAAAKLVPNNVYAHLALGDATLAAGRFKEAKLHFDRALVVAPHLPKGIEGGAVALFEMGDTDLARSRLAPLARAGILGAEGWFAWGYLEEQAGRSKEAETAYAWALHHRQHHRRARFNRGRLRLLRGDARGAEEDFSALMAAPRPPAGTAENLEAARRAMRENP